jgi:polysaccharide export outer membrane protein
MRRLLHLVGWVALAVALGADEVRAQRQQRDAGVPIGFSPVDWAVRNPIQGQFYRLPGISADYRLGPGDELEVFISGYSDRSVSVTVSESGDVTIPLMGTVRAAETTTIELEERIAQALIDKQLVLLPEVLVHVAEHVARPIYVLGEVDFPGQYMMSQQLTVMEAIFLAGGLDFPAARYGYLHRRVSEGPIEAPNPAMLGQADRPLPGHTVMRIDLQPLKEGGVLESDIMLRPGDVIAVPRRVAELFYVIGDVTKAGSFEIPAQRTLTVGQALAYAGGPTKSAKASRAVVIRTEADGTRRELPVDFAAVLRGKKADFDVLPNDVIFVPGAAVKTFSKGLLGVVPGILQTALVFY